jgi:energy-coupling factor transporter transmembrane protein EcfT
MMQYNRLGLYTQRKKKTKVSATKEKSVDWINIFLFVLLFVVVILFVVT